MPITFSITCDTKDELAEFIKTVDFGNTNAVSNTPASATATSTPKRAGRPAKAASASTAAPKTPKKTASAPKVAKAKPGRPAKAKPAVATAKKTTKAATKASAPKATAKPASKPGRPAKTKTLAVASNGNGKPGRKPGKLSPLITEAIGEMTKKSKPFRSREVIDYIMKKAPELNESSVTTGVSKVLSESKLKSEQIKDVVGRPYRLYKP